MNEGENPVKRFSARKERGQDGFTLVEMVVALFIVAVVMAIALPNLQAAGTRAAVTGCEGNQRAIRAALTEYYLNEHQYPQETTTAAILLDLKNAGYLASTPTCPSGGQYVITIAPGGNSADVTCTVHGELGS